MDEYTILSGFVGGVVITGIAFTLLIFHRFNLYLKESRVFEAAQVGAVMAAAGTMHLFFSGGYRWYMSMTLAVFGILLILVPFAKIGRLWIDRWVTAQLILIALSAAVLIFPAGSMVGMAEVPVLVFLILLMNIPLSVSTCTSFNRLLVRLASWLIVLHSWLRDYALRNPYTCVHYGVFMIYFTGLVMWTYSVMRSYEIMRRWV